MSLKLSDKQREFLCAAAESEDGLLAIPPQLKDATAQKVGAKLVAAGLAKEVKAKSGGPVWRRDAETSACRSGREKTDPDDRRPRGRGSRRSRRARHPSGLADLCPRLGVH